MSEDKEIQKVPKYSIDNLSARSRLASRGLRDLGLLKDKKHFTIIYTCQFCGRLINYSSTPCIFCGNYPKDKREVIKAQALSSNYQEVWVLLAVSKAIKGKEDLEIVVAGLKELIDDVLEKGDDNPMFKPLFNLMNLLLIGRNHTESKALEMLKRSNVVCQKCGQTIFVADYPCLYCAGIVNLQGGNPKSLANNLSPTEKWIVALNSLLLFVETDFDFAESEDIEELIFVSVYVISQLIEKGEFPDRGTWDYWKELLHKTHSFGSEKKKTWVGMEGDDAKANMDENAEREGAAELDLITLCSNLSYLLKQNI